jgi:glycosyltransferase involved in cell wall biosynthesis
MLKELPLVTVYITNFNYRNYIEKSIESVLLQTLQDFELIIIDDGSSDGSQEFIKKYESNPKIRCIYQHNKGLNVTNNIALRSARGKFIMRLDADDWLDPNALELMSNLLLRNDNVGLVFPDYYTVDKEGELIEQIRRHSFDEVTLFDQPAHGACTMIRCECLREIGGYDEMFSCQDGYDLWIRFIENFKVQNINLPLFYYRQHGSNLTRNEGRILETRSNIVSKLTDSKCKPLSVIGVISVRGPGIDSNCLSMEKLGGKRLLDWTIEAACNAGKIEKVVLDTPDKEIFEYSKRLNNPKLIPFRRPLEFAKINTPIRATLLHALETAEKVRGSEYDALFQLMIESPFRNSKYLDSAIRVMELFETDLVIGVRTENDIFYNHNGHGLSPINKSSQLRLERKDIFREVGSMRLFKVDNIKDNINLDNSKVGHVVLDQKASTRLVSKLDWKFAEFILNNDL